MVSNRKLCDAKRTAPYPRKKKKKTSQLAKKKNTDTGRSKPGTYVQCVTN